MPFDKDNYMEALRKRGKESHVYRKYQMVGLMLAEMLQDEKHKALFIKLAKEHDHEKLLTLARSVADRINVKNRGAYFMGVLFKKKTKNTKVKRNGKHS